jgi:hypothetical protein
VTSKCGVKINFKTSMNRDTFGGALLYHLQREENTPISAKLLVIWGWNTYCIYSRAWIIEHDSTLDWDKDKLKRLYDAYHIHYYVYFYMGKWLLSNNTKLQIVDDVSHGYLKMEVIISREESRLSHQKPPWIHPNK